MKVKILFPALAVAVLCSAALTMQAFMKTNRNPSTDSDGHVLTTLWKAYYAAEKADLPKKMSESLDKIKEEARARRYHWDFYDAAIKKIDTESSRNWKLRQELRSQTAKEIEAYDEPIVTYAWKLDQRASGMLDYVLTNRARLEAGRNQRFYTRTSSSMNGLLNSFIKNDFEYALWSEKGSGSNATRTTELLKEYLGDSYPAAAWLEFLEVRDHRWPKTREAAEAFAEKYKGRAINLFGKALALSERFTELERAKAGQEDYKALYADVQSAEKERKSYKRGVDGTIAGTITNFKSQLENLERKDIDISFSEGQILLGLRNIDKVRLTMAIDVPGAAPILDKELTNPDNSFYVIDTLKVPIPRCDDGDYLVKAVGGKVSAESRYESKTLSIAVRSDATGWKFYVADYLTGCPAGKVDLRLALSGVTEAVAHDVEVDGFTALPGEIAKHLLQDKYYTLEASLKDADGFLHRSKGQYLERGYYSPESGHHESVYCNLFTDKSAYNPGETLKFKAVLYKGDMIHSLHTLPAGEAVKAVLVNAENKEAATADLTTNEYGSVAGEFPLPEGERGGSWTLKITRAGTLASKNIVVDEFVLPTYDLTFEDVDSLYFAGDVIEVKGILKSYSGHPLDAASLSYTVDAGGARLDGGDLAASSDGTFAIRFQTLPERYWYQVTVRVTDATGETKEFSRYVWVLNYLNVSVELPQASDAEVRLASDEYYSCRVVSQGTTDAVFTVTNNDGVPVPLAVNYTLEDSSGETVLSGKTTSGQKTGLDLPRPGMYLLTVYSSVKASDGRMISTTEKLRILRVGDADEVLQAKVGHVFKMVGPCAEGTFNDGDRIDLQIGAGDGPVWAVVELFGDRKQLLDRRLVHLEGRPGEPGSLTTVSFDCKEDFPEALFLAVFYFRNESYSTFSRSLRRERKELELPLSFSTFEDKALPGKKYSLTINSGPGAEALAAVFDKSSETIAPNSWNVVRLMSVGARRVSYNAQSGGIAGYPGNALMDYAVSETRMYKTRATAALGGALPSPEIAEIQNDGGVFDVAQEEAVGDVAVRSDFSTSLAFEPFLRTDSDGKATFSFRTSDKLSTFVVQVYAHTPDMQNAVLRKEMTVSLPVKVNVVEPKYLYNGDKFVLKAVVSNASAEPVSGTVALQAYASRDYEGRKPYSTSSRKINVPAGGSEAVEFDVDPRNYGELGLKVVFAEAKKTFSDGVFVSLPVHDAEQTLTEAHSAVLLAGMDKNALLRRLRGEFTGTTSQGAEYKEIDIRGMILDAVPSKVEAQGKDVLSLSEALYVRRLAARLGADQKPEVPDGVLYSKILACRNADGGFGWFEGMKSSPVITAVLLERLAKMAASGLLEEDFDADASVAYLDRSQFVRGSSRPLWCGWISNEQYAYVRSLYSSVPFDLSFEKESDSNEGAKNFKEFQKYMKDYLVPSEKDGRGLNGMILAKARRIRTLVNLVYNEGGVDLASSWGIRFSAESKMRSSLGADVASLYEYAVEHRDGGWYYPNAVMPWRGLLESELYAHSLLCDLLSDSRVFNAGSENNAGASADRKPEGLRIADGIRIWTMLQKETQQWADDPAYVDALNSVLEGGEDVLSTKVILLEKTYRKPFSAIVAAGNGFTIERHFYKEVLGEGGSVGRLEIYPGMRLQVGDKVTAEYKIWNQENRSFVKLTAPREAAFRPVDQLSGRYGWWLKPLSLSGVYSVTPQGYRNVRSDCTEYYFDVYPEENTTVSEEFFITQEGVFSAPVVTIESLYAPHYRANDKFGGRLKVSE